MNEIQKELLKNVGKIKGLHFVINPLYNMGQIRECVRYINECLKNEYMYSSQQVRLMKFIRMELIVALAGRDNE